MLSKKYKKQINAQWERFRKSIWVFPTILAIGLITLTVLRISGSSIGIYPMLDGTAGKDPGVVALNPRGVRSDEWLVNTQMVVAQANNDFKRINDNIGNGQDMSLIVDVPYKEWSAAFKPQNLIFLVLPLEHAFAFKWWLLAVLLILACYFFMLELFPGKRLRSAVLSLFAGLTPMVFWWYQSATVLPIAYSFFIMLLVMRLCKAGSMRARLAYSLLLAYVLICFGLILYPPFQIPCLIVSATFLLGWILEHYRGSQQLKKIVPLWPYVLLVLVLVASTGALFYYTRKDAIHTITHTVYPGTRVVLGGSTDPLLPFSSSLSPNLEYDDKAAAGYLRNQSEASNFILLAPYLLVPSLLLIIHEKKKNNRMPWGLVLINALIVFFLFRMFVYIPWLELLYRPFLLDKVPNSRLLLGLGVAGVIQLALLIKGLEHAALTKQQLRAIAYTGALTGLVVMLVVGVYTIKHFPVFIASYPKVLVYSLWIAGGIFLLLRKKFTVGLVLLAAFSLLSIYRIHPLYRGLGPVTTSPLVTAIASYPENGAWVVLDDRFFINFPLMAGKHSLNSVDFYPQLKLWTDLDTQKKYDFVYDRFAHVVFTDDQHITAPFTLQYADTILVKFAPCQPFLQTHATYVLSPKPLSDGCVTLDKTVTTPASQFFIYKITTNSTRR